MYNTHLNDELKREQKHTEMVNTFNTKVSEVNTFVDTKKEEINSFVSTKTEEVEEFVDLKTNEVDSFITTKTNEINEFVTNKTNEVDRFVVTKGQEIKNAINSIPPKSELIGAKGDKGDKGEKGDKGDKGEQGLKGDKGDTPSIVHLETQVAKKINEADTRLEALEGYEDNLEKISQGRVFITDYEVIGGSYIAYATGSLASHTSSLNATGFIPMDEGSLHLIGLNYPSNDLAGLCFYDNAKRFIQGYQYNKDVDLVVEVPNNAHYVRITIPTKSLDTVKIYQERPLQGSIRKLNDLASEVGLRKEILLEKECRGYVDNGGKFIEDYVHSNYKKSYPVEVKANEVLDIYAEGYKSNVSILAKYDRNTNKYTPLVVSQEGVTSYTYTVEHDMEVVVSTPDNFPWALVTKYPLREYTSEVVREINDVKDFTQKESLLEIIQDNCFYQEPEYVLIDGCYIRHSDGGVTTLASLGASDFIDVTTASFISIKDLNYPGNDLAGLCFYDRNKRFIQGYQYNKDVHLRLEIPKEAYYTRFTYPLKYKDTLSVSLEANYFNGLDKVRQEINQEAPLTYDYTQILHKIAGIGDSLMSGELAYKEGEANRYVDCYNYSWLSNLSKNVGAICVHYSNGGATASSWLSKWASVMESEEVKPSAYYIALGTNDSTRVPLGTVEDCGTDAQTFYGTYSKIIERVQAFNPKARIFCCSLYFSPNNANVKDFCQAIKTMAEMYGCIYIDFLNTYGKTYTGAEFVSVGHFTSLGYVRVGKEMQKLTNDAIHKNLDRFNFIGIDYKDI